MPLAISPIGEAVVVERTPGDESSKRRLESLGIFAGEKITPLSEDGGNIIIRVGASRIAINRELAMRIRVRK